MLIQKASVSSVHPVFLNDGSGKMKVISADMTLDRISVIVNAFIEMKNAGGYPRGQGYGNDSGKP